MSAPLGHPTQDESDRPFPKKARALGQWWARSRLNDMRWQPVRVRPFIDHVDHPLRTGQTMCVWQGIAEPQRADDPDIEWGDPIPQPGEEPWTWARKNELLDALITSKECPVDRVFVVDGGRVVAVAKVTARAEGFWWVNVGSAGFVAQVFKGFLHCPGSQVLYKIDEEFIEWGPYLGQEPQDFLAAIVAYASDHGTDRVGGLSFEEIVRELATAGADTLRIVVDEGRRSVEETPTP